MDRPKERFFDPESEERVLSAIRQAEQNTSGEIRVHLERSSGKDPYKRAQQVFSRLGMHRTAERNGVLFYLATEDHKFTILGDKGIDQAVPDGFWNEIRDEMQRHFRLGEFEQGLSRGILMAGEQLAHFFPHSADDINELDDEISES
ncbi:MAG: Uncharacterised protein [Flavobacteriia bacterium]|nr:MAG: Uncharacterised protein [Flavobacteriia bacterium]